MSMRGTAPIQNKSTVIEDTVFLEMVKKQLTLFWTTDNLGMKNVGEPNCTKLHQNRIVCRLHKCKYKVFRDDGPENIIH